MSKRVSPQFYPAAEVDRHIASLTEIIQGQHKQLQADSELIKAANEQVRSVTDSLKTQLSQ